MIWQQGLQLVLAVPCPRALRPLTRLSRVLSPSESPPSRHSVAAAALGHARGARGDRRARLISRGLGRLLLGSLGLGLVGLAGGGCLLRLLGLCVGCLLLLLGLGLGLARLCLWRGGEGKKSDEEGAGESKKSEEGVE